jgi:thioredoxin 2
LAAEVTGGSDHEFVNTHKHRGLRALETAPIGAKYWQAPPERAHPMTQSIHVVCPHCSAVNRMAADRPASEAKCGACKASLFTGEPIALTAKTFDKHVERNDMPLIVDFWAPWCGPCRAMTPIFDKAAKELEPRARFAKVNVDEEPAIAARFGIRGIPTLIAFEKGKVAKQHSGLVDLNFLKGLARGG